MAKICIIEKFFVILHDILGKKRLLWCRSSCSRDGFVHYK